LRHVDDPQDARGPALRLHPLQGGARAGRRPRRVPGPPGWAARAHDRGEGDLLPDRRHAGVPRLPDADPAQRGYARRDADRRRARRGRRPRHAARPQRSALCKAAALSGLPRLHSLRRMSETTAAPTSTGRLTVVTHPLVQHKLSYLRDKNTPTVHFRKLVNELTLLLTYEATKDMPTEDVRIETPLEGMTAQRISGKKVAVCPVLRAGVGMLDGVLSLVSSARVGFIGLYR